MVKTLSISEKKSGNTQSVRQIYSNGDGKEQCEQERRDTVDDEHQETQSPEAAASQIQEAKSQQDDVNEDSPKEIIDPSGMKNSFTQVTNRDDIILEENCCKSVQVTDRLHQGRMFQYNESDYTVSSRTQDTLPKSTFRSEAYQPEEEEENSSLASDECCNCCGEVEAPPKRKDSLQRKNSPPPVPPHRVHLESCEAKGMTGSNGKYPTCSCGYKWERDFISTDDSSMLSRIGARLIGSRTSNSGNTSVSEGDYCIHAME
ncbi:Oidioi.mRNA.OKI2018_I69.chr2.g5100.t1.cds [Oikopleura dioica]|uniref:Oidioi.mRNA.OKI2018_I69.chr2.g5100.t1.cds n=1 Tax=Oikopleura dioica TaxID=34765 RepID=A0ABN7T579_OIKDI|nr:Oidioi.mRNA.OKI2018_I69.chr2.g5100.t1.cds [Oikopleura dioica]